MDNIELALQVKVNKVASFVGKIFMIRPSTTKTTNILPHENYPLYNSENKNNGIKIILAVNAKTYLG